MQSDNDNSWMLPYIKEAWDGGYQSAIDTLQLLGNEYRSEDMKTAISTMVDALRKVKQ